MLYHIWFGEIKRFIRDDGPIKISRSIKDLSQKIREIQKEFTEKEGKEPTVRWNIKEIKN